MAAKSSYQTYLMYKATTDATAYTKLIDIKNFPDLGGSPERLESTTLSDPMQTFVEGIQQLDELQFNANYDKTVMTTLNGLKGQELDYAVWFGATTSNNVVTPSGTDGKFSFKGTLSAFASGKGVNEVREISITISNTTPISFA